VHLAEGRTAPAEVELTRKGRRAELSVKITEGLNRQVRRMLAAVGLKVRGLCRVSIGSIGVGKLKPGKCRRLSDAEIRGLLAGGGRKRKKPGKAPARKSRPAASRKPVPKMTGREKRERRKDQRRAERRKPPRKGRQRRRKRGG